jgi:hypothetical protein
MATYRLLHVTRDGSDSNGLAEFTNSDTVLLPVHSSDPTGTTEGEMIYNSTDDTIKIYTGSAWETVASDATAVIDADADTKIQVEESSDEDKIRYDVAGTEVAVQDVSGMSFTTNSSTVRHHQTQAATYTIPANEGQLMAGPVTITGTITNNGTLVII